ncbi:MAG TPA: hypothetical protein VG222_10345 [Vicinamibacterales bacterium]|nr:hypothetical protein [Vicinamibacterales bacterium]
MPFLRFSRDKRGYEHFYLIEPTTRRGKSRNRILYWFRTPPGVKVGRLPFDDQMRRALEVRYPDVKFDWQKLIDTPIPPPAPDVERWRERRRLERAAKQAALAEAAAIDADDASEAGDAVDAVSPSADPAAPSATSAEAAAQPARRRRRRSGRRGRTSTGAPAPAAPAESGGIVPSAEELASGDAADSPERDDE